MNILEEVMTFNEACTYLGVSVSYLNYLVQVGKLKEDVDYRKAGRNKLILRSKVEEIKKTRKNLN